MARYDRIARIDPPGRDDAFTGWLAVRDLQDRERDKDLGRRARLRFLTVRVIHRLALRIEAESLDRESLARQADAVREELGQLPSRDRERERLADVLKAAAALDERAIAKKALELGDSYRAEDQPFAAEEFYHVASALAGAYGLGPLEAQGQAALATLDGANS